jgi:hypothetical protein
MYRTARTTEILFATNSPIVTAAHQGSILLFCQFRTTQRPCNIYDMAGESRSQRVGTCMSRLWTWTAVRASQWLRNVKGSHEPRSYPTAASKEFCREMYSPCTPYEHAIAHNDKMGVLACWIQMPSTEGGRCVNLKQAHRPSLFNTTDYMLCQTRLHILSTLACEQLNICRQCRIAEPLLATKALSIRCRNLEGSKGSRQSPLSRI